MKLVQNIEFQTVHRLGRRRDQLKCGPIGARFKDSRDRDVIRYSAPDILKVADFGVREQFCKKKNQKTTKSYYTKNSKKQKMKAKLSSWSETNYILKMIQKMYKVLEIEKQFQLEIKRATISTEIILMSTLRQRCISAEDTKEATVLEENQSESHN